MNHVDGKPVKVGYLRNSAYTTMNNGSVRSGMAQEDLELLLCLNLYCTQPTPTLTLKTQPTFIFSDFSQ